MKIGKFKETFLDLTFLATGEETNGKYFLNETIILSGDNGPPIHVHSKYAKAIGKAIVNKQK